ncbi:ATP-binding protein [Azospirillum sp. TSO35-2]|uniref:hybrid sensor histidine kinase/response regulator n=1 Tax=Azospirillum sp. TSO35-2 TaxID=716796 RepID=UPI000D6060EB|nr:ATP-binding protein [Azospirillum sp. TSO35-2]PWC33935.1 histidine kinase [Azospirillum sp. TSO35-2]
MCVSAALRTVVDSPKGLLASVFVALSLLGAVSWATMTILDYDDTLARSEQDVRQAAALFDGHAGAVLDDSATLLSRVADRMDGRGLAAWAGRSPAEAMAVERSGRLTVLDAAGTVRFGSAVVFDGPDEPSGFSTLIRPMTAEEDRAIQALTGEVAGDPCLLLARRIHGAAGALDGVVLVAVPMSALAPVLRAFGDGVQRSVGLFRLDGVRLVGFGAARLEALPQLEPGGSGVVPDALVGSQPSVLGLKRMPRMPILSAVAIPRSSVLGPWYVRLDRGLVVMLVGVGALGGLSLLGWSGLRREASVRRALTEANTGLEQRVAERTAALSAVNLKLSRALEEKERANQAKGRFLSAANHDLRQPFQALRLFHHILMERLSDPRDRSVGEKMGEALDAGENLLHSLLEVATLDAGVVRPQLVEVPVTVVFEDLLGEFRAAAADKGLHLRAIPCRLTIRTDRAMLTRMLGDLMRNAIRFTDRGRVTIGCRRRGQWLRIEVWDTGTGIPAEQLDNIFEDFVQLGNPERDRRQGLGLGLAKVRRKAALLGHAVEVRSHQGRGSVFAVHVPVVGTDRTDGPVPLRDDTTTAASADRLILVVEDDPVQRDAMRLLLESWGHRVIEAENGEAALALLRDVAPTATGVDAAALIPDMVVSDFRLPGGLSGVQTVARVGELLGRAVPGLILTGDTAPERIRDAVATGCRLLHKPVMPDALRDAIATVLAERPAARVAEDRAMESQSAA